MRKFSQSQSRTNLLNPEELRETLMNKMSMKRMALRKGFTQKKAHRET